MSLFVNKGIFDIVNALPASTPDNLCKQFGPRPDKMLVLILIQTVCTGYQQTTPADTL